MRYIRLPLLTLAAFLLMAGVILPLIAQDNSVILTVAVEEWRRDQFQNGLFDDFTVQHPGVKVVVVPFSVHLTVAPDTKPEPFTNSVKGPLLSWTLPGLRPDMLGEVVLCGPKVPCQVSIF